MSALGFDLNQLTTLSFDDFPLFLEVCALSGLFRLLLTKLVIAKIAKLITFKSDFVRFKFTHRGYDLVHYTISAITGLLAIHSRPYHHCYYYTFDCGVEFMQQAEPADKCVMSVFEKIYYMTFTAYYVIDLFFIWTNKSDKTILTLHHFTTLSLILISVYIRTHVIGVAVMLLHDVVDVPLYSGKIFTYLQLQNPQDVALLLFAAMCTWFRMICYPGVIFHGIVNGFKQTPDHLTFYCIEGCILFVLMFCHIIWFIRIVKAAIGIFTKGKDAICDNRSDDATTYIKHI
ncbi:sphingosine N-acyltransferase lag1 [Tritrichomonas musculus]|uniref:Sphingosine N-acyltransferase lag1 n=1 Tax=Tritrichomonas musculus TaxID=1915356 RepID=A0ABR2GQI9_9EUKA